MKLWVSAPAVLDLSSDPVHKTFTEHPGRLLNVLYIFNLGLMARGNKHWV